MSSKLQAKLVPTDSAGEAVKATVASKRTMWHSACAFIAQRQILPGNKK